MSCSDISIAHHHWPGDLSPGKRYGRAELEVMSYSFPLSHGRSPCLPVSNPPKESLKACFGGFPRSSRHQNFSSFLLFSFLARDSNSICSFLLLSSYQRHLSRASCALNWIPSTVLGQTDYFSDTKLISCSQQRLNTLYYHLALRKHRHSARVTSAALHPSLIARLKEVRPG